MLLIRSCCFQLELTLLSQLHLVSWVRLLYALRLEYRGWYSSGGYCARSRQQALFGHVDYVHPKSSLHRGCGEEDEIGFARSSVSLLIPLWDSALVSNLSP